MYYIDEERRGFLFTVVDERSFTARETDIPEGVGAKMAHITKQFNEIQEYMALLHRSPLRMHRGFPVPDCLGEKDGKQAKPKASGKGRRVSQHVRAGDSKAS